MAVASMTPTQLAALTAALSSLNQVPGQEQLGQSLTQAAQATPTATNPAQMAGRVVTRVSPLSVVADALKGYATGTGINQTQAGLAQQAAGRGQVQQMLANLLRQGVGTGSGGAPASPATGAPLVPWDQQQQGS